MEELFNSIFKYLISEGGVFGLLFGLSMFWIFFRETKYFKKAEPEEKANEKDETKEVLKELQKKVQDLWEWHAVFDEEGVPIWYVRKSLGESIGNLESTMEVLQEKVLQANEVVRKDLVSKLQKVNDERVNELKELLENYNKTVTDLIIALEKIRTVLKSDRED